MKIKHINKIISLLLCILLIGALFSGCSGNDKAIDFIYPFSADVKSYDPQIAGTTDEFLIIENTFEGLIRIDDDGTVKAGVADSWDVSNDGLTYTFKLKKGIKWNIDTEKDDDGEFKDERLKMLGYAFNPDITAHDFVFALQRAAQQDTDSPLFSTISCIKNAASIHNGKKKSSNLGVKAIDDYTLQISLSIADDSFMNTLTTAVAMPCNKEFFEATKGRYGLSTEYTLFNGQFYLSQILESSYLLKNNEFYKGDYPSAASELTLKISESTDNNDLLDKLKSGYYDAAFISGKDSESIKNSSGITSTPYNDTTWAFLFNTNNVVFQSKTMRKAFCTGLTRLDNTGKEYLTDATNLLPSSCTIAGNNAIAAIGTSVAKQNVDESITLWKKGLSFIADTDFTITVITTEAMQDCVKKMLQGIQSGIGNVVKNNDGETINFTIKVEAMSESDLNAKISSRDYDIAFCPFKSSTDSAIAYLKSFSDNNPTGFNTKDLNSAVSAAEKSTDLKSASNYVKKAEKSILNTYSIYPMIYESGYYVSAKGVSGVQFHAGSGRVSFVNATRQ
ncbi:MAG: ABC transporter substrate-binding protein [Eubacterium sp.]